MGLPKVDSIYLILSRKSKGAKEELQDIIRDNYEKTSVHGGQTRQGMYWKNSTREWVIERSFKDYQLNREAEEWED